MKQFLTTAAMLLTMAATAQTGLVELTVTGIDPADGGELSAGMFNEANFPNQGKQIVEVRKAISGKTMVLTFTNVKPGDYAIATYQDIDSDKKLKTNWVGFPKEPIGFSRDAKILMGPPKFSDARFVVEAGKVIKLTVKLN